MTRYRRPAIEIETFLDDDGRPIPYGDRGWWVEPDGPPREVYSRCEHPQRFEPVVQIARALVEHLVATYDVDRTDAQVDDRDQEILSPRAGGGATLTVVSSGMPHPGVWIAAGHRFTDRWPGCECDACDDDVLELVGDLEAKLLAIAAGKLSEWRSGPDPESPLERDADVNPVGDRVVPWHVHAKIDGVTEEASWGSDEPEPVELPDRPCRWPAWPLR